MIILLPYCVSACVLLKVLGPEKSFRMYVLHSTCVNVRNGRTFISPLPDRERAVVLEEKNNRPVECRNHLF